MNELLRPQIKIFNSKQLRGKLKYFEQESKWIVNITKIF